MDLGGQVIEKTLKPPSLPDLLTVSVLLLKKYVKLLNTITSMPTSLFEPKIFIILYQTGHPKINKSFLKRHTREPKIKGIDVLSRTNF